MLLGEYQSLPRVWNRFSTNRPRENNGLFGMGDDAWLETVAGGVIDPTTGGATTDAGSIIDLIQKGMIALNTQQVFQLNLDRLQRGLTPIPTQYASPTMNLGIAGVSSTVILAGLALLAFVLLKKR